jgi:acyl-CoA reductase-like NAD-dependent aldehyde dehydrogenase
VLIHPPNDMAVMRDEIFGPILQVKPDETLDQVTELMWTRPGRSRCLFTADRGTE